MNFDNKERASDAARWFDTVGWGGLLLSALVPVVWVLTWAGHGFDFTDEGFYLNWIANPYAYPVSATQFGYVYHLAYEWLDGDVHALRIANVLLTVLLSFAAFALATPPQRASAGLNIAELAVAAGLASSSLAFIAHGLLTPSYNSLSLQGLLLVSVGLLLSGTDGRSRQALAALAIGAGGALCFLAKPPVAAALAPIAGLMLWVRCRQPLRCTLWAVAVAGITVGAAALMIDGSLVAFKDRLWAAFELTESLDGYQTNRLLRLDALQLSDVQQRFAIGVGVSALAIAQLRRWLRVPLALLAVAAASLSLSFVVGWLKPPLDHGPFLAAVLLGLAGAYLLPAVLLQFSRNIDIKRVLTRTVTAMGFSIFPWICALGTNNNQWLLMGTAAVFWLLAAHVLVAGDRHGELAASLRTSLAVLTPVVCTAVLAVTSQVPYRQPPNMMSFETPVAVGSAGQQLRMQQDFAKYVSEVRSQLLRHGFEPGSPMVDLTGQSPGLVFLAGAKASGSAWLIGGYSWSAVNAQSSLAGASCEERRQAWLIEEPGGPRSMPVSILWGEDVDLESHYDRAFETETPEHAGGYLERRPQVFWKPKAPGSNSLVCPTQPADPADSLSVGSDQHAETQQAT